MRLAHPIWLLTPVLVALVLLAVRWSARRARTYAIRFPATETVREALAAGGGGGWRRQAPLGALLAALALLAVGLARPSVSHRVPIRQAALMLVLDHSGSMAATDVQPTRLAAAIRAANTFIDQIPSSVRVGAVAFSSSPDAVQRPVTAHAAARSIVDNQTADGGTDTGPALALALELLRAGQRSHPPSAIVLLSDGAANLGVDPVAVATQARRDRVPIYTVALGTPNGVLNEGLFSPPVPVPPDPQLMAGIARSSGGRSFDARTAENLSSIYQSLGRRLSTVAHRREVTVYFLLAAGVVLLLAVGASVRTAARLP